MSRDSYCFTADTLERFLGQASSWTISFH